MCGHSGPRSPRIRGWHAGPTLHDTGVSRSSRHAALVAQGRGRDLADPDPPQVPRWDGRLARGDCGRLRQPGLQLPRGSRARLLLPRVRAGGGRPRRVRLPPLRLYRTSVLRVTTPVSRETPDVEIARL